MKTRVIPILLLAGIAGTFQLPGPALAKECFGGPCPPPDKTIQIAHKIYCEAGNQVFVKVGDAFAKDPGDRSREEMLAVFEAYNEPMMIANVIHTARDLISKRLHVSKDRAVES